MARDALHDSAARMLCATGGALLTSVVTTPLEVVKTRMQSAVSPPALPLSQLRALPRLPLASALSTALTLVRAEGFLTLWSGLSLSLVMQVPSTVLYFQLYDNLRENLEARGDATVSLLAPMGAGIVSRAAVVTVLSPLELVRTRAMAKDGEQGMLRALRAEVVRGGVSTLWRGWLPTLARDVPFSGIYWFSYERAKRALAPRLQGEPWLVSFTAGLGAGVAAALVTTPQDLAKTHRQLVPSDASVWTTLRAVHAKGGVTALFAGATMRCARVGPACAIMISTFELGKRYFGIEDYATVKD
jgi:solute carrier family 25 protein 39/40